MRLQSRGRWARSAVCIFFCWRVSLKRFAPSVAVALLLQLRFFDVGCAAAAVALPIAGREEELVASVAGIMPCALCR